MQVQGAAQSFRSDPLKGQPTGADWIVEYTPGTVGTYRVEVTGLGASAEGTAEAVKGGTTFRVIGAGGTDEIVEGARPEVIPARTVPKSGASGVQVSTYVQVVFTEPVRKVSGNVLLKDAKGQPVAVKLSGVLRHGGVVEDLAASPDAVVTSLTVQPLSGLEYGATYRLELGDGIEDLDTTPCGPAPNQPPPCKLVPYDTQFTTFTPESLSTNPESFGSPGIVVLGERAYLVQNHFYAGTLRVFETADPVTPLEIPNSEADSRDPRYTVSYRPVDLVGETDSPLTGGRVVAVVTGPTAQSKPSNVWLLDVNDDAATQWIGAVSLTSSAQEGFVSRSFLRAGVLYAATFRKGIQVVDLGKVKDAFKPVETDATGHFQMRQAFLTDGQGYGQENVIGIPVSSPFGGPARLNDIEAALTQTADGAQVLVAAPGDPGLTVVNPATQSVLWNDKVTVEREVGGQKVVEATLRYGQAIGLGNVAGQDLAVVVGSGTILQETQSRPLLMVVSLYDPEHPVGLGYVPLDDATVGDVILKDDLALLGGSKQVTLVSLTDKTRPKVLGTVPNLGGRLAIGDNGILIGSAYSPFGGNNPLGGVRTATLDVIGAVRKPPPTFARPLVAAMMARAATGVPLEETTKDIPIQVNVFPSNTEIERAEVELFNGGLPAMAPVPVPFVGGGAMFTLAAGFRRAVGEVTTAILRFFAKDGREVKSPPRPIPIGQLILRVDSNNDTKMGSEGSKEDADDEQAAVQGKAFTFWESDSVRKGEDALVDYARLSVRRKVELDPDSRVALRIKGGWWEAHRRLNVKGDFAGQIPLGCTEDGKVQFCNSKAVDERLLLIDSADPRISLSGLGDTKEVPHDLLSGRETELLFRCVPWADGDAGVSCPNGRDRRDPPHGSLQPPERGEDRDPPVQGAVEHADLAGELRVLDNWKDPHYQVASDAQEVPGWASLSPKLDSARNVTLIVHGYAVHHEEFTVGTQQTPSELRQSRSASTGPAIRSWKRRTTRA